MIDEVFWKKAADSWSGKVEKNDIPNVEDIPELDMDISEDDMDDLDDLFDSLGMDF